MSPNGNVITEDSKRTDNNKNNVYSVDTYLKLPKEIGTDYSFKREIVWFNAIGFFMLHLAGLIGIGIVPFVHPFTVIWSK